MIDWSKLKDFLEVAETGSLSAAAKKLKVSQPTLGRRIKALENEMETELFIRTPQGLNLTKTGELILESSKRMQHEAYSVERLVSDRESRLSGKVIVSIVDGMATHWLVENLSEFYRRYPDITLIIQTETIAADLLRREADIALRMFEPKQKDLISKKGGTVSLGLYASKEYISENGMPKNFEDLKDHKIVVNDIDYNISDKLQMGNINVEFGRTPMISNNMTTTLKAIEQGIGIGVHAKFLACENPNLVELFPGYFEKSLNFWLVSHSELKRSARIRAVFDYLSEIITKSRHLL